MAQILVNEISENYTYSIVSSSFATVALPITAAWGPAFMPPESVYPGMTTDEATDAMLEDTRWLKFESNQAGLESFVATFRGPSSNYRIANDYSYQQALTLLSAGYDVLVCRVCPGAKAHSKFDFTGGKELHVKAKYPGTFGNNLIVSITKTVTNTLTLEGYWNVIIYIQDPATLNTVAAENISFVFGYSDTISSIDEIKSNLVTFEVVGSITDTDSQPTTNRIKLSKGTDTLDPVVNTATIGGSEKCVTPVSTKPEYVANTYYTYDGSTTYTLLGTQTAIDDAWEAGTTIYRAYASTDADVATRFNMYDKAESLYMTRYTSTAKTPAKYCYGAGGLTSASLTVGIAYGTAWGTFNPDTPNSNTDTSKIKALTHMEWVYNAAFFAIQLLKNKLDYNPNRLYIPWDDQNTLAINGTTITSIANVVISPFHRLIMDTAFYSRCATGMIDIPRSLVRSIVYSDVTTTMPNGGYAQMLSHITNEFTALLNIDSNIQLYTTHSALFGPWAPYKLTGMSKQVAVSPSLIALLIHRAQLLNQATQYEWLLPDNRKHNLRIGEPDYKVPAKLRDSWQSIYGIGVNVIAAIPDLGINQWGNSTLFDVPPATYQALADLSTRWLVNAIEDVVYRTGISITFNYNNENAYSKFYVGVTPLLDSMLNAGAIEDYKIQMSPDLDALGQVKARSVIGKIWIVVAGVINDITVDLIALPPGTDLSAFGS